MVDKGEQYAEDDLRVLILLPKTRDAESIPHILAKIGASFMVCSTMEELCAEIAKGVGAAVIGEGAFSASAHDRLRVALESQPRWSELPIVVLMRHGPETRAASELLVLPADVILVERPVRVSTLVAVLRSALRSRLRQYVVRDQMQALQEAMDAAQAGMKAKSEFLANMSHEMRTPLAGALGMVNLVLEMDLGEEERQLLETARDSAESLIRLINDVLDFARLDSGRMSFGRKPFNVRSCIHCAVQMLELQAKEKGLSLISTIDASVPETIPGDEGRVRQVLINFLSNAVKFTDFGEIELSVKQVDDPTEEHDHLICFAVRDTGIGIAQEDIDKLFRMFSQLDPSTTRKYGGTGLGLALSKSIVERMGGRTWVKSRPGKGSTFYFTLPVLRT